MNLSKFGEILLKIDKTKVTKDFWDREKLSWKNLEEQQPKLIEYKGTHIINYL